MILHNFMEPIIWLWNTFEHIAISWCYPKILKWDRLGIGGNFNFWHFIFEFEDEWRDEDDLMKARGKTGRREPVCRQNSSRSSPVVPWIQNCKIQKADLQIQNIELLNTKHKLHLQILSCVWSSLFFFVKKIVFATIAKSELTKS